MKSKITQDMFAQSREFMARIEAVRERKGMTYSEFAKFLGYPFTTYRNWVHGVSIPNAVCIARMIGKTGMCANYTLMGESASCPDCAKKDDVIRALMDLAISKNPNEERRIRQLASSAVGGSEE